jgi:predicted nucleic acid-binding protein
VGAGNERRLVDVDAGKPAPAPQVVEWFETVPQEALFISALTLGEIRRGAEKPADHRRR